MRFLLRKKPEFYGKKVRCLLYRFNGVKHH